jgi:hypothetical protein
LCPPPVNTPGFLSFFTLCLISRYRDRIRIGTGTHFLTTPTCLTISKLVSHCLSACLPLNFPSHFFCLHVIISTCHFHILTVECRSLRLHVSNVPGPYRTVHFRTDQDSDSRIRTSNGSGSSSRILLFSSVTYKTPTKNNVFLHTF